MISSTRDDRKGLITQMTTEQAMDSMIPSGIEQEIFEPTIIEQEIVDLSSPGSSNLWKIIVHNDEVTPYDYVIHILGDLFMLTEELADHIAWTAHTKGVAVVVVRPRSEAEKLVKVAHGRARQVSYPLTFSLEQE
jgi:ATP-dependent Clp protease adaptor protein ClpS